MEDSSNKGTNSEEQASTKQEKQGPPLSFGAALPIGVALGTGVGVAMDNIGVGVAMGVAFASALSGLSMINKKK